MHSTRTTHRSRRWLPTSAVLLAFTLAAVACGGDDDDDAGEDTSPSSTTTPPTTAAPTTAAPTITPVAHTATPDAGSTPPTTDGATDSTPGTEVEPSASGDSGPTSFADSSLVQHSEMCAYRNDELIVDRSTLDEEDLELFDEVVGSQDPIGIAGELVPELALYQIDADPFEAAQALAGSVDTSPNYLFAFSPGWKYAPDDTPTPVSNPIGGALADGSDLRIAVLDTGYAPPEGQDPPSQISVVSPAAPTFDPDGQQRPAEVLTGSAAGHGTFIVNLLHLLLPEASITAAGIGWRDDYDDHLDVETPTSEPAVVRDDATVANAMATLAQEEPFDYLNLSLGTYGCSDEGAALSDNGEELPVAPMLEPLALRKVLDAWMARDPEMLVFAASGNDGHRPQDPEVFYPAAWALSHDRLFSVASDPRDGVDYSNRGAWVELQARGTRAVSQLPPDTWGGDGEDWHSWSGTSFATPCALALFAADREAAAATGSATTTTTIPATLDGLGSYGDCGVNE